MANAVLTGTAMPMQKIQINVLCQNQFVMPRSPSKRAAIDNFPIAIPMVPKTCVIQASKATCAKVSSPNRRTSCMCRAPCLAHRTVRQTVHP